MKLATRLILALTAAWMVSSLIEPVKKPVFADLITRFVLHVVDDSNILQAMEVYSLQDNRQKIPFRQQDIVNSLLQALQRMAIPVILQPESKQLKQPKEHTVIFIDQLGSYRQYLNQIDRNHDNFSGHFYVFLTRFPDLSKELHTIIGAAMDQLLRMNIVNVVVVVPDKALKRLLVYSYIPFMDGKRCGNFDPVLLYSFGEDEPASYLPDFFPAKLNNFHGCTLKATTYTIPPYVTETPHGLDGVEINIVYTIAKVLNFTLDLAVVPSGGQRIVGVLYDKLNEGKVDFVFGGMTVTNHRAHEYKVGAPHYNSLMTFAATNGVPHNSFEKLFDPFKLGLWLAICGIFGLLVVAICVIKCRHTAEQNFIYGPGNSATAFTRLFAVFIGVSLVNLPRRNFARFLLMVWLCTFFVLRHSYEGMLFRSLQAASRHTGLDTIKKVIQDRELPIYTTKTYSFFLNDTQGLQPRIRLIRNIYHVWLERFGNLSSTALRPKQAGCVFSTYDTMIYYQNRMPRAYRFHIIKEPLVAAPLVICYRKGSMLTERFNKEVQQLYESGLVQHWAINATRYPVQLVHWQELKNPHFYGTYCMMVGLLLVALMVFGAELLSRRFQWLRTALDFWTD